MDVKLIVAIIGPPLGIILGSLLSGMGYLYKEKYNNRRIVNQNIFYLLKVLHLTLAMKNIDKGCTLYIRKIEKYVSPEDKSQIENSEINQLINNSLFTMINPIYQKLNNDFGQKFNDSLTELSKVSPISAYDLSKNSYYEELIKQINQIHQESVQEINQQNEFMNGYRDGVKGSQKHVLNAFSSKLEKGIKSISWKSTVFTWIACRFEIYQIKKKFADKEFNKFIEEYVNNTVVPIIKKYQSRDEQQVNK